MKTILYEGNDIFYPLNFNLYPNEDINYEETSNGIINAFRDEFEIDIRNRLGQIGLSFVGLKWFAPKYYNYQGDSVDLEIQIQDKNILKEEILKNKDKINELLSKNESSDGYISTTIDSVDDEIKMLDANDEYRQYEVDAIVLNVLLSTIDFGGRFNVTDYYVNDCLCANCDNSVEEPGELCETCEKK